MNKKLALGVGVLCVAIVGGVWWIFTHTVPPNTIVLTDHGFYPRELTISIGDTVTFVNKLDTYFWPASDFHPTHTIYPEFDAKKALAPGSSWSFTFERTGLFKYHDHLAPFYFGVIRVRDEDGNLVDNCENRGGTLGCWQDQIFLALAEKGIGAAYDTVAKLYASEPTFASSCHYIAHNIGLASYGFYREDPQSILSPKASACASGFYHGFMEAYLGAVGDAKKAGETCDEIGAALKDEAPDARLQCYHGIGHGSMELLIAKGGVFNNLDDMVNAALRECEKASPGEDERFRCASGVFNSIANFYINGEYGLSPTIENSIGFCAHEKNESYRIACYGNMNSVVYWMGGNNFSKAATLTLDNIDPAYAAGAIEYLSGVYAYFSLPSVNGDEVIRACQALGGYSPSCVRGFVHGLLEHGSPGEEYTGAVSFCSNNLLKSGERDVCYHEAIGELPGWYSGEKSAAICNALPAEIQHYCKK